MSFDFAMRATEMLLGWAFALQSLEHMRGRDKVVFGVLLGLSLVLLAGVGAGLALMGLCVIGVWGLHRFAGPYNGGSDRMGLLILICLTLAHWLPGQEMRELALGYLALQLILSYAISGWVKLVNPDWRSGRALRDVFQFSAYPVSENLRLWADQPRAMLLMSWAVIGFELAFPLAFLGQTTLIAGLVVAALFHLANAFLFGLNRFFWVWIAAYPSILWLQDRLLG